MASRCSCSPQRGSDRLQSSEKKKIQKLLAVGCVSRLRTIKRGLSEEEEEEEEDDPRAGQRCQCHGCRSLRLVGAELYREGEGGVVPACARSQDT